MISIYYLKSTCYCIYWPTASYKFYYLFLVKQFAQDYISSKWKAGIQTQIGLFPELSFCSVFNSTWAGAQKYLLNKYFMNILAILGVFSPSGLRSEVSSILSRPHYEIVNSLGVCISSYLAQGPGYKFNLI